MYLCDGEKSFIIEIVKRSWHSTTFTDVKFWISIEFRTKHILLSGAPRNVQHRRCTVVIEAFS